MFRRSRRRACFSIAILATLGWCGAANAANKCELQASPEIPVTISGLRALIKTRINGAEATLVLDSGAFYSILNRAGSSQYNLALTSAPYGLTLVGVGGATSDIAMTTVDDFGLASASFKKVQFLVTGSGFGNDAVGLLGQNFLRIADVEYDFGHGFMKIVRPKGCGDAPLAYWTSPSQTFSMIDLERLTQADFMTVGSAFVNGQKMRVTFDTGAPDSFITLAAAARAGITPESPGVVAAGSIWGTGRRLVRSWIAPFASFKIGSEEVQHTHLRIAATDSTFSDMLIGADFFLSHHVYVSNAQRKLYFTYNGGPVFDLSTSSASALQEGEAEPTNAAEFERRGLALDARKDYSHAIADLTRACELEPTNATYFYNRALARSENKQYQEASEDLDQALKLKPDYVEALLRRAEVRVANHDAAGASTDLDLADKAAAKESEFRLRFAQLYSAIGHSQSAIDQYDSWIANHDGDARLATALNGRCWDRALLGRELDQALADCNRAIKQRRDAAAFLDSRGLVWLRRGEFAKAIADYDAALRLQPQLAWSHYGRGLSKLRLGKKAEAEVDIAAASKIDAGIVGKAANFGIAPP